MKYIPSKFSPVKNLAAYNVYPSKPFKAMNEIDDFKPMICSKDLEKSLKSK